MLRIIYKSNRHLIFWGIYIGYAIIYQKVAYPHDVNVWYSGGLQYLSFIVLFYWAYSAAKIFFNQKFEAKFLIFAHLFAALLCFWFIQFFKSYYIFGLKFSLWEYYLMQIPEIFLVAVFAVIFSLIEYTEQVNRETLEKLFVKNENEILLNKAKLGKEILIRDLDSLIIEADSSENVNELKKFRQLVDFLVNSTHKSLIPISLEIENLYLYLNLYYLRAGQTDLFKLEIVGDFSDWKIPHKSILTLIENTIKYGAFDEPAFINIDSYPTFVKIAVKNKIRPQPSVIHSTNIGLANLKDRFQLHLKGRHKIEVLNEGGWFEVRIWVFLKPY